MSRVWTSCSVETLCGSCRNRIRVGHPMQEITPHPDRHLTARERHPFVRCRLCADGEPPDDLPPPKTLQTPIKPTGQPSLPLREGEQR